MNIKIALVALSLTFTGYNYSIAQQSTVTVVSQSQFNSSIAAYEQANGANSNAILQNLKGQMRTAIADTKAQLSQGNVSAATQTKMQSRISAYNTVVQKEKANDKNGVTTALRAFANTL